MFCGSRQHVNFSAVNENFTALRRQCSTWNIAGSSAKTWSAAEDARMIRRAAAHDLDAVEQVYMELFAWERRHGAVTGWISGVYPSRSLLRRAAAKQELYALWDDCGEGRKIYGAVCLSREQPAGYETVRWNFRVPPREVLTVKILCVTPLRPGQTLGTQLLHYALECAVRIRCRAVRLNVWTENAPMNALCTRLGFRLAGTAGIELAPGVPPQPQNFYEYEIRPRPHCCNAGTPHGHKTCRNARRHGRFHGDRPAGAGSDV